MSTDTGLILENILLFTRALRRAGLPISPKQSRDFGRALTLIDISARDQVFYAARGFLVTRREHLLLFETLFNLFWDADRLKRRGRGQKTPVAPRHAPPRKRFDVVSYMAYKAGETEQEIDISDRSGTYSSLELLQRKEFALMTPEELDSIKRFMREMRWKVSLRKTRRRVVDQSGNIIHLRRAMRSAAKFGGVPLDLFWQRRKIKPRPIILIADISGSMEKYARLILQFFYSLSHSYSEVESFVFGTRLTRITPQLRIRNIDRAVDDAAREIADWSGGTRIGESLQTFNRRWSRRVLRRGAVVLVISDGWERGDVSLLKQEMRYLQSRCYRLIWLNPLLGKSTYRPLVEGMAAALPFIDDFLPCHNWQSLEILSRHLASMGQYRSARSTVKHS